MASATGIPAGNPDVEDGPTESQPLLGQPGDVQQKPNEPIFYNLISGKHLLPQSLCYGSKMKIYHLLIPRLTVVA